MVINAVHSHIRIFVIRQSGNMRIQEFGDERMMVYQPREGFDHPTSNLLSAQISVKQFCGILRDSAGNMGFFLSRRCSQILGADYRGGDA